MNIGAEKMAFLKKDYIKQKKPISVFIIVANEKQDNIKRALKNGNVLSDILHGTRYLAELPGNYLNPNSYEVYARSLAKEFSLGINVFDDSALKKMGCGGILAVGQGSNISPRMIVLEYKPKKNKGVRPLILVGKGITFDTGGISLKPSSEMHEMKYDMCGSSLVLHAIALAAAKQLSLPIISILGLAENMPGGKSAKPGDVYTAYDGTTVENQNTDAEGRLVLGDLLAYGAINYDPLCILDFATLTGACLVALGHHATAVMTSSEDLFSRIEDASFQSLDRIWRMPHWSVYGEGLKSNIADQRNIAGRGGGTISAMRFLSHFVPKEIPWAHFDIAGTAWQSKEFASQGKGATGWGLRFLSSFMQNLVK